MKYVPNMIKTAPITGRSIIHRTLFSHSVYCFDKTFILCWLCSPMTDASPLHVVEKPL